MRDKTIKIELEEQNYIIRIVLIYTKNWQFISLRGKKKTFFFGIVNHERLTVEQLVNLNQ